MNRHVKLLSGPRLIEARIYPAGSVVEVRELTAQIWIKDGIAEPHPGPVSEPAPDPEPEPEPVVPSEPPSTKAKAR